MTRRTVVWVTAAEGELADIWLASASRVGVTSACRAIDLALSDRAESLGSPLAEGLIAYDQPPLRVLFEILDDDRIVRILKVKPITASYRAIGPATCDGPERPISGIPHSGDRPTNAVTAAPKYG